MTETTSLSPSFGAWVRVACSLLRVIGEIGASALFLVGFFFTGARWRREMGDRIRRSAESAAVPNTARES